MLHGGALVVASAGVAVFGGLAAFLFAQALDDVLQFSLQKPVEQVSLLPFPGRVKSTALATLGGVLRPLSKASGGGIALMLATRPQLLPMATVAAAATAVAAYSRHRERYMKALEGALSRHTVDLSEVADSPLVVDKSMMSIIDRGLEDDDPTVVVFAVSLLDQLPADDALSRLSRLLSHPVPEVRAEAAGVYARIDAPLDFASGMSVAGRLAEEEDPLVVAALLTSVGMVGGIKPESMLRYSEHESFDVRRAGLATLMRLGWLDADERIRSLLESEVAEERLLGASVVGDLRDATYMAAVAGLLEDPTTRPAALEALSNIGSPAVSMFAAVLERTDLPLALRRTVVTALSNIPTDQARTTLVALVGEPDLGPSALHSLTRLRADRAIGAIDIGRLYDSLEVETRSGLLLAACSKVLGSNADGRSDSFVALELQGLHLRSVSRVLRILGLAHDPDRIDKVAESLASGDAAGRSNALELLEGTLDARSAMTVMPFMDLVSEGMPLRRVLDQLPERDRVQRAPAEVLAEHSDWWPRALALHHLGRDAEVGHPDPEFAQHYEDDDMIPLVEKVMILKGSAFFRHFPGSELGGIAALTQEVHAEDGEVIFEQGDEGDAFYVIVQGSVQILRGETGVATLGAREGFGEMAILDRGERSATAKASAPTTLLSLDRDSFDRVIERNPVVARGVYRVLTERLRNTLEKMDTA
jgi:HEAT repeat protein